MMPQRTVCKTHLAIYLEHGGDGDMYSRRGINDPNMPDYAWGVIDGLRQQFFCVVAGCASARYKSLAEADLIAATTDDEVRQRFRSMVEDDVRQQGYRGGV